MPLPARILLFIAVLTPEMAVAQASYSIDPVHSRVVFRVMHAGLSPSLGTVSKPSGRIDWDETDISRSRVNVQIPVNSLDMGDSEWNRKTLKTFLAAEQHHPSTRCRQRLAPAGLA